MAEPVSILEFLQNMIDNADLRDWFAQDPNAAMTHYGLRDVPVEDVRDALVLADDNNVADFGGRYDTGLVAAAPVFAPTLQHASAAHTAAHNAAHNAAVEHLSRYVTDNYIDHSDMTVDDSLHQDLHTDGGDVDQHITSHVTTASGHGAVSAGGDITDSAVTSGDDNQVGTGNVTGHHNVVGDGDLVTNGDDNTTSFGGGAATSTHIDGVGVGAGGALSIGGPANALQNTVDSHDHTTSTTTDTTTVSDVGNVHTDTETNSHNDLHDTTTTDSHDHLDLETDSHNHLDATLPVL